MTPPENSEFPIAWHRQLWKFADERASGGMTQNLEPGAPVSEGWSPEGSDVVCTAERTDYWNPEVDKLIDPM